MLEENKTDNINIAACLHPFSNKSIRSVALSGLSLFQIFNEPTYVAIFEDGHNVFVFVNDLLVPKEDWFGFYPKPGDIISIKVMPMGGGGSQGGGKSPGRVAAMIGITILAIIVSIASYGTVEAQWGPVGTMWMGMSMAQAATLAAAAAGTAVSIVGNLLINALIPIQKPKGIKTEEGKFSITSTQNAMDPYGAVTRVFGKHRQFPKYAALPYTEMVGQDCYLRCLFLIGKGHYKLSDHKIGENAMSTYTGVQMEEYFSGDSKSFYALYPNTVYENQISVALTLAGGWQEQATQANTDEISLEISFGSGLCRNKTDGHMGNATVDFQIEYAPYGTTNWTSVTNIKRFYFAEYPVTDIAIGQTVSGITSNATGTITYAHYTTANVYSGETNAEGEPIYTYADFCDWVDIDVTSGTFQVESLLINSLYSAAVSVIETLPGLSISGQSRTLYRGGYVIPVSRGQWKVRIRRMTEDNRDQYQDQCFWSAIRSLRHEAPVVMPGCTLIGLRIKATDQLNGVVNSYNLICEAILPVWDGTSWDNVLTRNPAWAFCEVLMGNSNERPVVAGRIELSDILNWSQNCAAAGRNFDYVLDTQTTVWDFLKDICAVGRASPGIIDTKFTVIQDVAQTVPIQHFSPRNSWGFKGNRAFPDFPHAFRVTFLNEAKNYQQDEITVYDDGYSSSNATRFENLNFLGVVSSDQIWKLTRYHMFCIRLRPEVFEFSADIEHMVCTRGDLIRLTHDVIKIGLGQGRVQSMTTSGSYIETLTFDDAFPMGATGNYGCQFRRESNATYGTFTVNRSEGDNLTVTLNPHILISVGPEVGDLVFFGEAGEESISCLVIRIEAGPDLSAKISAVNYDSRIYTDADTGAIPAFNSHITQLPIFSRIPPEPQIESYSYSYKTTILNNDGTYSIWFEVAFSVQQTGFVQGASPMLGGPDVISEFQAQYAEDDGRWVTMILSKESRTFSFKVQNGSSYDFRIRSASSIGNYSDWNSQADVTIALTGTVPPNVTGLQVKGGGTAFTGDSIEIVWTEVVGGGTVGLLVKDYEVNVYQSNETSLLRTEYITGPTYIYNWVKNIQDGGPRASIHFKVKARNMWNTLSATAAVLTATNAAPATPTGLAANKVTGGIEFYWTKNAEADLSYYQTRIKITSGGTFSNWLPTNITTIVRLLSTAEIASYGKDAAIYIEVKATDVFLQDSSAAAFNSTAGFLVIKETDIDSFAVTASKVFTKSPVIQSLTLTDNSPASGRVAWSACQLYYNGILYSISAGNTSLSTHKYIYWKDLASTFTTSILHPADSLGDWKPGEDFIIAVNIGGVGQEAWNAIANQVIGTAYIMDAAIQDAKIENLSGTKILSSSSIAIGPASTYGTDGIQLEYNSANPRFYAGNGTDRYVKFDGVDLILKGQMEIIGGQHDPANLLMNPGFEENLVYWTGVRISTASTGNNSNKCIEMTRTGSAAYAYQTKPDGSPLRFEVNYGEVYELMADILCDASGVGGYLRAYFYTKDMADISNIDVSTTSQTWLRKRLEIVIPSNCKFFEVYLVADGANGTVYIDNVTLTRIDALANSWASSADRTKIDGGNIHASSSVAIGLGTAWESNGIQAQYNGGVPRFYVGNGTTKYMKWDGSELTVRGKLNGADIDATTITAGKIVSGDLTYTQLAGGAASVTSENTGTTEAAASVVAVGGDKILIIARAGGVAGDANWVSTGGEGTGYWRYDLGTITVNIFRGTSSGTKIATAVIEGRSQFIAPVTAVIDVLAGDASGSKTYTATTDGTTCRIEIANLRR